MKKFWIVLWKILKVILKLLAIIFVTLSLLWIIDDFKGKNKF